MTYKHHLSFYQYYFHPYNIDRYNLNSVRRPTIVCQVDPVKLYRKEYQTEQISHFDLRPPRGEITDGMRFYQAFRRVKAWYRGEPYWLIVSNHTPNGFVHEIMGWPLINVGNHNLRDIAMSVLRKRQMTYDDFKAIDFLMNSNRYNAFDNSDVRRLFEQRDTIPSNIDIAFLEELEGSIVIDFGYWNSRFYDPEILADITLYIARHGREFIQFVKTGRMERYCEACGKTRRNSGDSHCSNLCTLTLLLQKETRTLSSMKRGSERREQQQVKVDQLKAGIEKEALYIGKQKLKEVRQYLSQKRGYSAVHQKEENHASCSS